MGSALKFIRVQTNDKLFNKQYLLELNGEDGSHGLHLAIVGRVFDVSKGAKHYGPLGGYRFFAGMCLALPLGSGGV